MSNLAHLPQYVPRWTFAERIRKVRRDRGLTQEEFAENVLGIRLSTYSAWETGRNTPDLAQLAPVLERKTGVPRAWFLGWMDEALVTGGDSTDPSPTSVGPAGIEPTTSTV
jgi:transcriptional regulator with XRE-family HTH domain